MQIGALQKLRFEQNLEKNSKTNNPDNTGQFQVLFLTSLIGICDDNNESRYYHGKKLIAIKDKQYDECPTQNVVLCKEEQNWNRTAKQIERVRPTTAYFIVYSFLSLAGVQGSGHHHK